MPIVTSLPNNIRRPGAFSTFKFNSALQLSLNELRAVIVAEKSAAGTATADAPIQVFDEDDADTKLGMGSPAALGVRMGLAQAKLMNGATPEIWCAPLAEPGAGAKATQTITITVTTALQGDLKFRIAGRLITVPVTAGDAQNTIATAVKNAIDALKRVLPGTASVAANVVTFTLATKGVNGNDVAYDLVSAPGGVTCVFAVGVVGTGAAIITTAIQALYDRRYHVVITSNHTTTDIATLLVEAAAAWGYSQQNYRFFFMGERGTLGTAQTLATAANDYRIVVCSYEQCPNLPIEIAVATAFGEFSSTKPNVNMDGQILALAPASGTYAYTVPEIESALAGGVTPIIPDGGSYSKIVRLVTTEITLDGVPTETVRDIAYPRTAAYRAELHEINFRSRFKQEVISDAIVPRVRDMQIELDRGMAAENPPILRDVESKIDQYQVEISPSVPGRIVSASPFTPAGPLHQLDSTHIMFL